MKRVIESERESDIARDSEESERERESERV
jgi:hypothetical protein